jgi:nucleotide-binding universal stress UspA family protein
VLEPAAALDLVDAGLLSAKVDEATAEAMQEEAAAQLAHLRAREIGCGVAIASEPRVGSPAAELLAVIKGADLLVTTADGAGGGLGWRIGGVAKTLLRRAPAPVAVLHARSALVSVAGGASSSPRSAVASTS